uniref:Ig-like domain-containing protein n=1 Tax=Gouania willdenowi TaxID=441366 RepID=A0A8C5HDT7_GOUWI
MYCIQFVLLIFFLIFSKKKRKRGSIVHFQIKTVHVKQDVALTCAYQEPSNIFWIRIILGHWPEFLGGTKVPARSDHITTKQEPGTFVLRISEAKLNDTGLYYCVKNEWLNWTFVTGHFIKVKETESDISSIIQEPPTVYPGVQTSVKCSLLSNSENKMCSNNPAFYWFKSALNKSHPSFIYTHNDGGEDCHSSLRTPSAQRCFYSFSRNFSDAGIYHCAVAACGHILWGQGTHLNTEDLHEQRLHLSITVLCLICAALIITVIVLVYCICSMKKKTCSSSVNSKINFIFFQGDEDPQVYSASVFNKTSWQQGRIYTVVVFQQTSTCKLNDPLKKAVFSLKQI